MDLPGRYGTVALLRQTPEANVVTSFGVDTPAVSFGRDPTCSVRLYYPDVSPLHARIVFNDARKAFLEVLGARGLVVDGCHVFPNDAALSPRTIALENGSEMQIHGKRFRFTYPPKDMRAALAASPARPANRALRLSMIASAQVFSPRPSSNPRENLRVLQSPLRAPFPRAPSPQSPSPVKSRGTPAAAPADDDDEHETITLVQGAHPRVVEEAKDLVILEDVEVAPAPPDRGRQEAVLPLPKTPRRQSLHRAVLIRSAHRAVLAATSADATPTPTASADATAASAASTEPRLPPVVRGWSAGPVAASSASPFWHPRVAPSPTADTSAAQPDGDSDTEEEEAEVQALGLEVVSVSSGSDASDEEDDQEQEQDAPAPRLGWRKSLERLWPFGRVQTEEEEAGLPTAPLDAGENEEAQTETVVENEDRDSDEDVQMQTPMGSPKRKTVRTTTPAITPTQMPPRPTTPLGVRQSPKKIQMPAGTPTPVPMTPFSARRSPEKKDVSQTAVTPRPRASPEMASPFGARTSPQKAAGTPFGARASLETTRATDAPAGDPDRAVRTPRGVGRRDGEDVAGGVGDEAARVLEQSGLREAEDDWDVDARGPSETLYADVGDARTHARGEDAPSANLVPQEPPARRLAAFMTPQAPRTVAGAGAVPRYSIGGVARRIPMEDSPWKTRQRQLAVPAEPPPPPPTPARAPLSEAERRAIKERRKSALTAPDAFWAGGVPGLSPRKQALGRLAEEGMRGGGGAEGKAEQGDEGDARRMLEEVFDTVDVLKRRRESVLGDAGHRGVEAGAGAVGMQVDVAAEAEAEAGGDVDPQAKKPLARMLRARGRVEPEADAEETKMAARTAASSTPESNADGVDVDAAPTPKMTRSRRKATPPPPAIEESDAEMAVDPESTPMAAPAKSARRGRKEIVEPESEAAPTKPRRGRKATAEPESEAEPPAPAAPKKPRRGRAAAAQSESDTELAALPSIAAALAKPRRGRAKTVDPESDNEPAAPVRRPRKPPSGAAQAAPSAPATEPAAPPARRGRAGKAAAPASAPERRTRGSSRAPEVVQAGEDADAADPLDTIPNSETADADVEIVAVTAPKRRARSVKPKEEDVEPVLEARGTGVGRGKKAVVPKARQAAAPASAPAGVEKENARGEEQAEAEGQSVVKVRVSRSRKVKDEPAQSTVAATAPKRSTRARTRT